MLVFGSLFLGRDPLLAVFFLVGGGRLWSTSFDVDIPDFSDSGVKEMKQTSIIGYQLSPVTLPYLFTQSLCQHTWQHNTASFNLISIIHVEAIRFKFRKVFWFRYRPKPTLTTSQPMAKSVYIVVTLSILSDEIIPSTNSRTWTWLLCLRVLWTKWPWYIPESWLI